MPLREKLGDQNKTKQKQNPLWALVFLSIKC